MSGRGVSGLGLAVALVCVACGGKTDVGTARSGPSGGRAAGSGRTTFVDASTVDAAPSCAPDGGEHATCDPSRIADPPWGPFVTVARGIGRPPAPTGGAIVPGLYQLIAETLYVSVDPGTKGDWRPVGSSVVRMLRVDCSTVNELAQDPNPRQARYECHSLTTRVPTMTEIIAAGAGAPAGGSGSATVAAYSAHGHNLTLIRYWPYRDDVRSLYLGSFASVEEYVFYSVHSVAPSPLPADAGIAIAPSGRDPRCPPTPPASGDPCDPDPVPLECEYADDPWHRCTTFAACAADANGTFQFRVDAPARCTATNPPECPPSLAAFETLASGANSCGSLNGAGDAGTGAVGDIVSCFYSDGMGAWTHGNQCDYDWFSVTDLASGTSPPCPWPRPLAGDPCPAGLKCRYTARVFSIARAGPDMFCQNGFWSQSGAIPPVP